jgi:hypothetical protein
VNIMRTIDIVGMIRGRREARAQGIEELANRLAAGEAVAPEEIEAILARTGTDEELLQAAVDRIERRAELLAQVSRGNGAQGKIDKIEGEIDTAWEAVAVAQRKHAAVRDKHAGELTDLRHAVEVANRASDELLAPANLSPADREQLAQARKAASDAALAVAELRRSMPDVRMSLEQAERALVDAVETARTNRGNRDVQDHKVRCERAVSARKERVAVAEAELPKLQAEADRTAAAVEEIEAELRR